MNKRPNPNAIRILNFVNLDTSLVVKRSVCIGCGMAAAVHADTAKYNTLVLFFIPLLFSRSTVGWNSLVLVLPIERRPLGRYVWMMRILVAPLGGSCEVGAILRSMARHVALGHSSPSSSGIVAEDFTIFDGWASDNHDPATSLV